MEQIKIANFLEENKDYLFPNDDFTDFEIEEALMLVPDSFEATMRSIPFRKPSTVQLISVFPGSLGVDRFYLGDVGKGVLKYFTFGGFGIWWIKDIISAKSRCRAYNCKKLLSAINDPTVVAQMKNTDAKINTVIQAAKTTAPLVKEIGSDLKRVGKTFHHDSQF